MSKFVFVGAFTGKGKESGRPFNRVTLIGLDEQGNARSWDLFTANGTKLTGQDSLRFGDVVEATFSVDSYPGARSQLSGLTKVADSPYKGDLALV